MRSLAKTPHWRRATELALTCRSVCCDWNNVLFNDFERLSFAQRAHRECETMRADLERAMFRDATATDERDVRLSECEAELADALQQLEAAEERIAAVHADAARKEHHATAAAQAAAGHVDALEREAAALRAELTMSTRTLSQQHDEVRCL
jgi:serine phosphatase RsbU (regulator of sigma subunit)